MRGFRPGAGRAETAPALTGADSAIAFRDAHDELTAHLERLHLLLRRAVARFRQRAAGRDLAGLDGIVVHDREIDAFLEGTPWAPGRGVAPAGHSGEDGLDEDIERMGRATEARATATIAAGVVPPLSGVAHAFGLSSLERDVLALCLAAEVYQGYARLFAYLQNDVTRVRPSVSLVLDLLTGAWSERATLIRGLSDGAPLLRFGLVLRRSAERDGFSLGDALSLEPTLAHRLLAGDESRANPAGSVPSLEGLLLEEATRASASSLVARVARRHPSEHVLIILLGPEGSGRDSLAAAIAAETRQRIVIRTFGDAPPGDVEHGQRLRLWLRDARLGGCCPCVDLGPSNGAEPAPAFDTTTAAITEAGFPVAFLLCESVPARLRPTGGVRVELVTVEPVRAGLRREAWSRFLGAEGLTAEPEDVTAVASAFPLSVGRIHRAVRTVESRARGSAGRSARVALEELAAAARGAAEHRMDRLAERVPTVHDWADIVLPADQERQLREIAAAVRLRERVLERWGFGRKVCTAPGLSVLFSGASGTGKTLSASIVARDLGMDLFRVDLSRVVSKYIGETEKNLDALFAEARLAHGILFFDEADALFGKRSEVRDAHDRYANIEVAFLLQRMESFEGVTILATNLRGNLDRAFLRRLQFSVEFQPPNEALRLQIWRKVWPAGAPLAPDVDLPFLAAQFDLPGGYIRNIALKAAYLAAGDGGSVGMAHIVAATRREFQKLGRVCVTGDFGAYGHLLGAA